MPQIPLTQRGDIEDYLRSATLSNALRVFSVRRVELVRPFPSSRNVCPLSQLRHPLPYQEAADRGRMNKKTFVSPSYSSEYLFSLFLSVRQIVTQDEGGIRKSSFSNPEFLLCHLRQSLSEIVGSVFLHIPTSKDLFSLPSVAWVRYETALIYYAYIVCGCFVFHFLP